MGYAESEASRETNTDATEPRLRVNKTSAMVLSTSYADVIYNGSSPYNLNSFGRLPGQTNPSVWYDTATGLIRFSTNTDRNYLLGLSTSITSTQLLGVVGVAATTVRVQMYIPQMVNGVLTPVMFPLPDFGGYIDIAPANTTAQRNDVTMIPFFANQLVRDWGFKVTMCLSTNPLLGTVTLNGSDINIFPA